MPTHTIARQLATLGYTVPELPTKWHPAEVLRCNRRDYDAPAGWFVDWQSEEAREFAYLVRSVIRPQPTVEDCAAEFGYQHWIRFYNAYNCIAGRNRAERRTPQLRDNDQRRYTRRRYVETVVVDGIATVERSYGIELEFFHRGGNSYNPSLATIVAGTRAAGMQACAQGESDDGNWINWRYDPAVGGWQGTYDSTVGPEYVSPPLQVTDDGLAQLSTVCELIRTHGGYPGAGQGTHVHIGTGDLDRDGLLRLVENIRTADRWLSAYVPATRRNGGPQGYSTPLSSYAWQTELDGVRTTGHGSGSHSAAYNFGHVNGRVDRHTRRNGGPGTATVEFRAMGHTLNASKLRVWVRVVAALVNATAAGHVLTTGTCEEFVAQLRTHGGLSAYAATRFTERATGRVAAAA